MKYLLKGIIKCSMYILSSPILLPLVIIHIICFMGREPHDDITKPDYIPPSKLERLFSIFMNKIMNW